MKYAFMLVLLIVAASAGLMAVVIGYRFANNMTETARIMPGQRVFPMPSGVVARDGALVSLDARLVLRDEGIHLPADSVPTDLKTNRHLIAEADLILAMTDEQIRMLQSGFPEAAGKAVYTLKAFAGTDGDIEDPAGRDEAFFAACCSEIKACLERAIERLASVR